MTEREELGQLLRLSVAHDLQHSQVELNRFDYERWLDANNNDLAVASKQLRYHLRFLKSAFAYKLHPDLQKAAPVWVPGCVDRGNNLMVVTFLGQYDAAGLERLKSITPAAFCVYQVLQYYEAAKKVRDLEAESGVRHGIHVVYDAAHLKLGVLELIRDMERMYRPYMQLLSKHLKGMARKFSVVNTNFLILDLFIPIARRLLSPTWRRLLTVSTKGETNDDLLDFFDENQLPSAYGGTFAEECAAVVPVRIAQELQVPASDRCHGSPTWTIPLWFSAACDFGVYYDVHGTNSATADMEPLFPEMKPWAHGRYLWEAYSIDCSQSGFYIVRVSNSRAFIFALSVMGHVRMVDARTGSTYDHEVVVCCDE